MVKKDPNKPKGRMSSYAFFVQTCREEHKKQHPTESVVFTDFSRKCADRWKYMSAKEKARFEDMAVVDKRRYEREMATYTPAGGAKGVKRKRTKDPDAPKRSLSAFFFFCKHERPSVKQVMPDVNVAEVAKELGKRWEKCTDRKQYEVEAAEDKRRYEREMAIYKGVDKRPAAPAAAPAAAAAAAVSPAKKAKNESEEDDEDDDDDDDEDDDDEDDDE